MQQFTDAYRQLQQAAAEASLAESSELYEAELQRLWQHGDFTSEMKTVEGHRLRILSPGWLNKSGGPDFNNAQLEFNGQMYTGDVEIHHRARDWYAHQHEQDMAYNNVLLHVVRIAPEKNTPGAMTQDGRTIATLVWPDEGVLDAKQDASEMPARCGACASGIISENPAAFKQFLSLAGEWRMLEKQRRIRERMRRVGPDQAMYEEFMTACGYSAYKEQFQRIAQALPYDRARQLAQQMPDLLEVALLRIAGLLPAEWQHDVEPPLYYTRCVQALQEHLPGLGALGLSWQSANCRPANRPERRLAGAARFLTRTADYGLSKKMEMMWRTPMTPMERRTAIEDFFGSATGFWANHCTWHGESMSRPSAPLGKGRIHTIIGNVLVPAALAWAREQNSALLEGHLYDFYTAFPGEPENRVHRTMRQWLFAGSKPFRMNFGQQQGLIQMYQDWCSRNPACRNCTLLLFLRSLEK